MKEICLNKEDWNDKTAAEANDLPITEKGCKEKREIYILLYVTDYQSFCFLSLFSHIVSLYLASPSIIIYSCPRVLDTGIIVSVGAMCDSGNLKQ